MATNAAVASGTLPQTDTNTVNLTSSGFGTPDAALIFLSIANTTNNPEANLEYCVGFWDGTTVYSTANTSDDAVSTTVTEREQDSNQLCFSSGSLRYSVSNTTDGITITKDSGTTSIDRYATAILINGLTNATAGRHNLGTGTSAQTITTSHPQHVVFAMTIGNASDADGTGNHAIHSLGVAYNDTVSVSQAAIYSASQNAVTTSNVNSRITNSYITAQLFNDSVSWQADVKNFTSTTFDIQTTASASSDRFWYLALELPDPDDFYLAVIDAATSTGTDAHTGTGFTPLALGLWSEGSTSLDSTASARSQSFGATDGTVHFAHFCHDEDAVTTTNANTEYSSTNIIHLTDDAGTDDYIAALSSLDSDGYTLNYSDAAAGASKIIAFAFGDSTAGGATYTLTCDVGSYATTGTDADLDFNRVLIGDVGSYSVSGVDATLTYTPVGGPTYTLASDVGSYATTGTAATLAFNRVLIGDVGSYSVSGTTAGLSRGYTISLDVGTYSITGAAATFGRTYAMAADVGAYTYTGVDATLSYSGQGVWLEIADTSATWSNQPDDTNTWTEQ